MKKLLSLLSVLTITGTSLPSAIAASNYEKIENIKKLNRTKREKMIDNDFSFVEKIYDQKNKNWNLLLFLKRNMVFNIIKLFIQNNKDNFIVETKKIITKIKNSSINLSAEAFDDNAIDAFANQIWKNFPYFCDLFVNLGINQNIQIRLDIGNGEWFIHNNKLFQIIGEKTEWEKNEKIIKKIKPYSNKNYPKGIVSYAEKIINNEEKNIISLPLTKFNYTENEINFVEKIYNYHKSIYETLLILTKEKSLAIIKLFIQNNKDNFIVETKKLITKIKNNSINLSAEAFDDNAIDAFANQIWKKFPYFCDLFVNLGINQNIQIRLDIGNGEWFIHNNKLFQIIGEKTEWEKNEYYQNNNEKNTEKECKNKLNQKYNVIEKWYNNIIKIKINKISYFRISMLFFMIKDKSIFIKKLTALFSTFSSIGSYNLNTEDIKTFAYLIWENFSNYYDAFLKLKNDESIRISYKTNYSIQKWSEEDFEYYNEIVDQNNDVVDWQTFNNRKINNNQKEEKVWTSNKTEFKRKKRPNKNEKLILLNDKDLIKIDLLNIIFETNLGTIKDNSKKTILQRLQELNPHIDISQINLKIIDQISAIIMPIKNSNHYTGSVMVNFTLNWEDTLMVKNIYDVLGDGNCLFWAVSTTFLLPVRNNNAEFQNRFIRLFGRENIQYLIDIQKLLQNFDLQKTDNNQNWYRNVDAINLVTNVFRNRVVDYISAHLDTFRGENNATFRSSILHDPISQRLTNYTEEQRIENYLNNMRLISTWGGSIEIEAMADILGININRHSSIMGNEIFTPNNENTNNNIQIFHINENHYNFGLSNQNYNKQQDKSEKKI